MLNEREMVMKNSYTCLAQSNPILFNFFNGIKIIIILNKQDKIKIRTTCKKKPPILSSLLMRKILQPRIFKLK